MDGQWILNVFLLCADERRRMHAYIFTVFIGMGMQQTIAMNVKRKQRVARAGMGWNTL
eukprot:jgi/Psemu1/313458/fgenesh1_kg.1199_\